MPRYYLVEVMYKWPPWKCAHPQFWPQKHAKLFMASRGLLRSKGFFFCDDVENPSHGTREISEWQPLYLCRSLLKLPQKFELGDPRRPNFGHGLSSARLPRPPGISCLGAKRAMRRSGRSAKRRTPSQSTKSHTAATVRPLAGLWGQHLGTVVFLYAFAKIVIVIFLKIFVENVLRFNRNAKILYCGTHFLL